MFLLFLSGCSVKENLDALVEASELHLQCKQQFKTQFQTIVKASPSLDAQKRLELLVDAVYSRDACERGEAKRRM